MSNAERELVRAESRIVSLESLLEKSAAEVRESRETIAMLAQQIADKKEIIRRLTC